MVNKQPEALRLADVLSACFECNMEWYEIEAARELRRLHDENEALKAKLLNVTHSALDHKERGDELLEALKWIDSRCSVMLMDHPLHGIHKEMAHDAGACASAAIAKAGGAA